MRARTANVVGKLPGSDPKLADEAIVGGAHHDHLGVRGSGEGDRIHNGALDNASGVAAMLELAESLAGQTPRPRRSLIFVALGAEESGLLGSEYFCAHPVVPAGRIAAMLNIDGVNTSGRTSDVGYIGLGKSSLEECSWRWPRRRGAPSPPTTAPAAAASTARISSTSRRSACPALYLKAGILHPGRAAAAGREEHAKFVKERYHQPSDELDGRWTFDGAVEDLQLMAVTLLRLADAPTMPPPCGVVRDPCI